MYQFDLWSENVSADFDPSCWHAGWSEPLPCDEADLDWDDYSDEEVA